MVTTRAKNYEFTTHTKMSSTKYNLRPRKTQTKQTEKSQHQTTKQEVSQYIQGLKRQRSSTKVNVMRDVDYNLRSKITQSPRVNYARFYTSNPEQYLPHHFIRRSPRIRDVETCYCEIE